MRRNKGQRERAQEVGAVAEQLVSRLYDEILHEGCVVFVGAGSTTERRTPGWDGGFYNQIKTKSQYPAKATSPPFPDLMEYFCQHVDGGRHNRLIREAVSRIERFSVPGDEYGLATMLSNELAEIPFFNRFVTTNWDPFLERALEVMIPVVEDRDLAFWDDRKRQVLKIHGCITRPYSVVATKSDYDLCLARNPLIFNKLKDLMATKTFIFVGYSLRDADFQAVWAGIIEALGHFTKLAYAVDSDASTESTNYWREHGIELFRTSDLAFVRSLRARLEKDALIPPNELLSFFHKERRRIASIHVRLRQNSSGGMASAMYQDGLLHSLDDVLVSTALGTKKKEMFERDLMEAEAALEKMYEKQDPIEVAYWSGRREVLERLRSAQKSSIRAYFHPNRLRPIPKFVKGDIFDSEHS